MIEKLLYDFNDVIVTPTQFKVPGKSYTISQINAVKKLKNVPTCTCGCVMMGFGLLAAGFGILLVMGQAPGGVGATAFYLILAGIGGAWHTSAAKNVTYDVVVTLSSGEGSAYKSASESEVDEIIAALNQAIILKGGEVSGARPEGTSQTSPLPAQAQLVEDIPAQIKKLAELRDCGVLTEEEFAAKKAQLLERM